MLSYEQATEFLERTLRMPPTWKSLLQENPLEFFTLYLKRHAILVPFQGMNMASVNPDKRWFPSEQEIMENGLSGQGGCCLHLNYFTKMVFQAIGVDAFAVRGDHYCAPVAGTHCMCMVRLHGPKQYGVYMIEVGGAFPMIEPVPMDSEKLPYRTLQAAGYAYEFREIGMGWVGKFHIGGGIMGGAFTDKKEILRTAWQIRPRALWEFDYPMLETFTNPSVSVLLKAPGMFRYFSNSEFKRLFPELPENSGTKKCLGIKPLPGSKIDTEEIKEKKVESNQEDDDDLEDPQNFVFAFKLRLVVADKHTRKVIKNYNSYAEMAGDLKKYFPMVSGEVMDKAIKEFEVFEPKPHPFDLIM